MSTHNITTPLFDNWEDDDDTPPINKPISKPITNATPKTNQRKVIPYNTLLSSSLMNEVEIPENRKTNTLFPVPKKLETNDKTTPSTPANTNNNRPTRANNSFIELWPDSTPVDSTPLKKQAEQLKHKPMPIKTSSSSSILDILPPPSNPVGKNNKSFFLRPASKLVQVNKKPSSDDNEIHDNDFEIRNNQLQEHGISSKNETLSTRKNNKTAGAVSTHSKSLATESEKIEKSISVGTLIHSSNNNNLKDNFTEIEANKLQNHAEKNQPGGTNFKKAEKIDNLEYSHNSELKDDASESAEINDEMSEGRRDVFSNAENSHELAIQKNGSSYHAENSDKPDIDKNTTLDNSKHSNGLLSASNNSISDDDDIRNMHSLFSGYSSDEDEDDKSQPQKGYFTLASPYTAETPKLINYEDDVTEASEDTIYPSNETNYSKLEKEYKESEIDSMNPQPVHYHTPSHNQPDYQFNHDSNIDQTHPQTLTRLPPPNFDYTHNVNQNAIKKEPTVNSIPNSSMRPKGREWKELHDADAAVSTISANSLQNPNWYMENKIRNEPTHAGNKKYTLPTRTWSASDGATITVAEPRKLQKSKHQINWLAMEASQREAEINAITARARQHKYDSRLKYGW